MKKGVITQGGEHDYGNIDDFFRKRPRSNMLDFMPGGITRENYKEIIETKFVWIGLVENFLVHVGNLAQTLGVSAVTVERLNISKRDEELSSGDRRNFIANNPLEFEIYKYVRARLMNKE